MSFPVLRMIDFIYSASIAYVLEFGDLYIRVYYADELVTTVTTPYLAEHLFELQYRQIGDVMRIAHPSYHTRWLKRTSATAFVIEEIPFNNGPFQTRNDLIDPYETNPATMSCSNVNVGEYAVLSCSTPIFNVLHEGCLFQLTHPKSVTTVSASGTTSSYDIYIKGAWKFITRGTWTGTVLIERNENDAGWETFRTYKGSSGAEQNVSLSLKEDSDNVQYRINSSSASSALRAELSAEDLYYSGIVRVTNYSGPQNVICEVVTRIESVDATRRWAEGSWSDYRGWPASLTFFEDRCVYAGALSGSDRSEATAQAYPVLQGEP
jgi:hypothetical protein